MSLARAHMPSFARILVMLFLTVAVASFNLEPISPLVNPAPIMASMRISRSVRFSSSAGRSDSPFCRNLLRASSVRSVSKWRPAPQSCGTVMVIWLLLGLVVLTFGCSDSGNPLSETEWRLVALGNSDAPDQVVDGDATVKFTTATDMTGWTGCNACGARYSARESELRLDELTWTEAGCPSMDLFRQEQRMQDLLATVEQFTISKEQLTLHSEGGQALVFERVGKIAE